MPAGSQFEIDRYIADVAIFAERRGLNFNAGVAPPVGEDELLLAERSLGLPFPASLRAILLQRNGIVLTLSGTWSGADFEQRRDFIVFSTQQIVKRSRDLLRYLCSGVLPVYRKPPPFVAFTTFEADLGVLKYSESDGTAEPAVICLDHEQPAIWYDGTGEIAPTFEVWLRRSFESLLSGSDWWYWVDDGISWPRGGE